MLVGEPEDQNENERNSKFSATCETAETVVGLKPASALHIKRVHDYRQPDGDEQAIDEDTARERDGK